MTDDFKTLAAQLRDLQDATKAQIAGVMARAEEAGLDPAGLRRFVSWKRKNEEKRAQQEAIDQQCRYLAGERDTPAQLPIGCELAQALNLYRRDLTVRQVAEEMRISVGKAGKLRQLSRMFAVHVHATVDKIPSHDPDTGEVNEGNSAHEGEEKGVATPSAPQLDEREEAATQEADPGEEPAEFFRADVYQMDEVPPAGGATSAVEMGHGTPDAGLGGATLSTDEIGAVGGLQGDRVASPEISCKVDDGKPCPNTCARQGYCVWDSAPQPSDQSFALSIASAPLPPSSGDGLDIPPRLRRTKAAV
jgi:uncharacterized protein (UPF0335 family)